MSLLKNLEADLASWWQSIEGDLESAGKTEAQAVATAVAQAAPTLVEDEVQTLVSGNASQAGQVAAKLVVQTAKNLEGSTVQVGTQALLAGVSTTVTSIQNAAKAAA